MIDEEEGARLSADFMMDLGLLLFSLSVDRTTYLGQRQPIYTPTDNEL